jgi:cell division protein FtsB
LSKAADIYWDSSPRNSKPVKRQRSNRERRVAAATERTTAPWWLSVVIVTSIFAMLCVSINFRAFSAVQEESGQNLLLSNQIQNLMDENLALQEEIHLLKTDPGMIEREARRLGIQVNSEKVPVPAN